MTIISRILIIYAHATPHQSRVNRRLIESARTVANVTVHDLYETYPDFHIDIRAEQQRLANADLIIFQHPIQWYGMPSLLKEWVDSVLEHGWAYGEHGNALRGKDYWLAATTGSTHEAYRENGSAGWPFAAFLPPFKQTAQLCGMRWLPPHVLHGAHQVDDAIVSAHVEQYRQRLLSYPNWPECSLDPAQQRLTQDQLD